MAMPVSTPAPPAGDDPFRGMPATSEPMAAPSIGMKIPEMTALREWEDKHQKELEEAQHNEDLERKAKKQKAEEEIKAFYAERATNIEKTKIRIEKRPPPQKRRAWRPRSRTP